jgi:hypothetical protein
MNEVNRKRQKEEQEKRKQEKAERKRRGEPDSSEDGDDDDGERSRDSSSSASPPVISATNKNPLQGDIHNRDSHNSTPENKRNRQNNNNNNDGGSNSSNSLDRFLGKSGKSKDSDRNIQAAEEAARLATLLHQDHNDDHHHQNQHSHNQLEPSVNNNNLNLLNATNNNNNNNNNDDDDDDDDVQVFEVDLDGSRAASQQQNVGNFSPKETTTGINNNASSSPNLEQLQLKQQNTINENNNNNKTGKSQTANTNNNNNNNPQHHLPSIIRSPTHFYFMEQSQYDPNAFVTVRNLPQKSIRALLDVVVKFWRQEKLEFLRSQDLKELAVVVSQLNLVENTSTTTINLSQQQQNNKHQQSKRKKSNSINNNLSSTGAENQDQQEQQEQNSSSSIHVFTEWINAINEFAFGSEGTIEETAFQTTARVILRKGFLGHKAVHNMVRIADLATVSERTRYRLLMMIRQCITCKDDEFSEATLVVSNIAYERNMRLILLGEVNVAGSSSLGVNARKERLKEELASGTAAANDWEALKHTLSLKLDTEERQDIFAEWDKDASLGPKLVTMLSNVNPKTIVAALRCGNALLLDGNKNIQDTIYQFFVSNSKEDFFVYCRRFFVICRDQIRDRRRTLKRWIDELNVVTSNAAAAAAANRKSGNTGAVGAVVDSFFEIFSLSSSEHNNDNNNKNNKSENSEEKSMENLETVLQSMQLIEGLYNFTMPKLLLRFVQLLCEGHNHDLQSYLRFQGDNQVSINVIESILSIFEELAASVDHGTFDLTLQTINTLIELVQGPCVGNQKFLISQNIGGVITTIFCTTHSMLSKDQLWNLRNGCVKLLLALQEGHMDLDVMSTLIQSLDMTALVRCMDETFYEWEKENEDYAAQHKAAISKASPTSTNTNTNTTNRNSNNNNNNPNSSSGNNNPTTAADKNNKRLQQVGNLAQTGLNVGLNLGRNLWRGLVTGAVKRKKSEFEDELNLSCGIFIFMKTLLDVSQLYEPKIEPHQAIVDKNGISIRSLFQSSSCYKELSSVVSTIEIMRDGNVERVYFRVPEICKTNLQEDSKKRLIDEVDRTGDGGRLADFHERLFNLLNELDFFETVRQTRGLSLVYQYSAALDSIALVLAFVINGFLLAYVSYENLLEDPANNIPPGTPQRVFFILCVTMCAIQSMLFLNFFFGSLRVYLNEQWQSWCENLNREAIRESKENLSIEPPRIEEDPKASLPNYEVLLYNGYFILTWPRTYQYALFLVFSFLGLFYKPYWFCIQPLQIVWKFPQLLTVLYAISKNSIGLLLTALLLFVITYIYSVISYFTFSDMFDEESTGYGGNCDSLVRCFATLIVYGLLAGGGISDAVKKPIYTQPDSSWFYIRLFFDFSFFVLLIILLLNLVFGIILDTFGELREARDEIEVDQEGKCFICGISRGELDKLEGGFEHHIKYEHNMWAYLYFMKLCATKPQDEHTGSEGYVYTCMHEHSSKWFPIGRSLAGDFKNRFDAAESSHDIDNSAGAGHHAHHENQNNNNKNMDSNNNNNNSAQQRPSTAALENKRKRNTMAAVNQQPNTNASSIFERTASNVGRKASVINAFGSFGMNHISSTEFDESPKIKEMDKRMKKMEEMLEKLTKKLLKE